MAIRINPKHDRLLQGAPRKKLEEWLGEYPAHIHHVWLDADGLCYTIVYSGCFPCEKTRSYSVVRIFGIGEDWALSIDAQWPDPGVGA